MRRFATIQFFAALFALLGAALATAAIIVFFGLYDVSARNGQWPGVSSILHTTYNNSVRLRAPDPDDVPDLDQQGLTELGAKHYDSACSTCHASPGEYRSASMEAMLPPPPHISNAVRDWQPNQLFWIVKHGVKMSGMPYWPSQREDEIWAVVAFLSRVEDMDSDTYRRLVKPPNINNGLTGRSSCVQCHGSNGLNSDNPQIPRLDIQNKAYLKASLKAYRNGSRESGIMRHAASQMSMQDLATAAAHYSQQPVGPPLNKSIDPALIEQGRKIAFSDPDNPDIPACRACHGPWPTEQSPLFPNLSGQHRIYLETQLKAWRAGIRGGTRLAPLMRKVVKDLSDDQIRALAAYYASLAPAKPSAITRTTQAGRND